MAEPTKVRIVLNGLLTGRSKWILHSTWPGPFMTVGVLGDLVPRITLGVLSEQKSKQRRVTCSSHVCSRRGTDRFRFIVFECWYFVPVSNQWIASEKDWILSGQNSTGMLITRTRVILFWKPVRDQHLLFAGSKTLPRLGNLYATSLAISKNSQV